MLEIKFVNIYLKKLWMILFLILIYQITIIAIFVSSMVNQNADIEPFARWMTHNLKNLDLILLGIFIFPIIARFLKENEFYKNYLLTTKKHFKSNLIVIAYFLILVFVIVFIKKIIFQSVDYHFIKQNTWTYPLINLELSIFAELHLVIASLFVGKIISILPIKKSAIFYTLLILVSLFILLFLAFLFPLLLIKFGPKQSTDVFSRQTLDALKVIKTLLLWTPLIGWSATNQIAYEGHGFGGFLNYDSVSKNVDRIEFDQSLAIWIIISLFLYIGLIVFLSYSNKAMLTNLYNKINFRIFEKNKQK